MENPAENAVDISGNLWKVVTKFIRESMMKFLEEFLEEIPVTNFEEIFRGFPENISWNIPLLMHCSGFHKGIDEATPGDHCTLNIEYLIR